MFDANKEASTDDRVEVAVGIGTRSDPRVQNQNKSKGGFRLFPWLLLLVGLSVGLLGGLYLHPLVMTEAEANAAPVAELGSSDQVNRPDPQAVMAAVVAKARHFDGDPNAPVTLVEFGDFKCGYCGKWTSETLPLIREKYVESGDVRIAYVNYPVLGPGSMAAAEAAECAAQQGNFWEYADRLYEDQRASATPENFTALAEELGLNIDAFGGCLANFPEQESLESDIRLGQMLGVRGTPAFIVNGVPLSGALPYQAFEQIIEGALNGEF